MDLGINLWAALGFLFAAYAVVGNDALQTLGTFINSNKKLPWWATFFFAGTILLVTFAFGYVVFDGDPSWGRLSNTDKYPLFEVHWYHVLPAIALLVITAFGIPVSTTFMILTIFATMAGLQGMLVKSVQAYVFAFTLGLVLYAILAPTVERYFLKTPEKAQKPFWILLQWCSTGYLWAVWLIQDFANIYIYLPRQLSPFEAMLSILVVLALLLFTFIVKGGPVQKILRSKTSVTDIRSATIIDFSYASVLAIFAWLNNTPMSTTWAFLGLIAGREVAIATIDKVRPFPATLKIIGSDASKALFGLLVSVTLAVGLPRLAEVMHMSAGN
jgi:phosphate/sulfate permease